MGRINHVGKGEGDDFLPQQRDALKVALWEEHRIEVPITTWPGAPHRLVRVSAQLYNELPQYERLAAALVALLGR